jgi:chromosome segregation ATPase
MKYMILAAATAAALCATFAAVPAQAQPMPPQPNTPAYKACMAEEGELRPQRQALSRRFHEHEANLERASLELATHEAAAGHLNRTDSAAVAAYNARQEELNAQAASLNTEGASLEKELHAFNARVAAGNIRCGNILAPYHVRKKEK